MKTGGEMRRTWGFTILHRGVWRSVWLLATLACTTSCSQPAGNGEITTNDPNQSRLLLRAPLLEHPKESFRIFGYSANQSWFATSALVEPQSGAYPRMEVVLSELSPGRNWPDQSIHYFTTAELQRRVAFFRGKDIRVSTAGPPNDDLVRFARFTSDGDECAAFEVRHRTGIKGTAPIGRLAITGIYCAPEKVPLTDPLINSALRGIYVKIDGRVQRFIAGDDSV